MIKMPLKGGYSEKTIRYNIAEMTRAGRTRDKAVAAAYRKARTDYKKGNPGKPLPKHLRRNR